MTDFHHRFGRVQSDSLQTKRIVVGSGTSAATGAVLPVLGEAWLQLPVTFSSGSLGGTAVQVVNYTVIGKTCIAQYRLSQTATGTSTNILLFNLPIPAKPDVPIVGSGNLFTAGGTNDAVLTVINSGSNLFFGLRASDPTRLLTIGNNAFGPGFNVTWTAEWSVTYEIA